MEYDGVGEERWREIERDVIHVYANLRERERGGRGGKESREYSRRNDVCGDVGREKRMS